MAVTNMSSYDAVGIKEDVSDIITTISPTKTPFQSSLRSEKIHQKRHDWQEDALDAAADNSNIEGANPPAVSETATTLRTNYTQLLMKQVNVTGSMDASDTYGRAKESAYQMSKKMQEIKRDLEKVLVGFNRSFTVGSSGAARIMASAPGMIGAGNTTAAGAVALTEAHIQTSMQLLYNAGGEASTIHIKPADAQIIAGLTGSSGRSHVTNDDNKTLTAVVNVYQSPWGDIKVVMNRFQLSTIAMFYDPQYWRLLTFRPWFREVLAKTGDSQPQMIAGEYSLKHANFLASALVTGIT